MDRKQRLLIHDHGVELIAEEKSIFLSRKESLNSKLLETILESSDAVENTTGWDEKKLLSEPFLQIAIPVSTSYVETMFITNLLKTPSIISVCKEDVKMIKYYSNPDLDKLILQYSSNKAQINEKQTTVKDEKNITPNRPGETLTISEMIYACTYFEIPVISEYLCRYLIQSYRNVPTSVLMRDIKYITKERTKDEKFEQSPYFGLWKSLKQKFPQPYGIVLFADNYFFATDCVEIQANPEQKEEPNLVFIGMWFSSVIQNFSETKTSLRLFTQVEEKEIVKESELRNIYHFQYGYLQINDNKYCFGRVYPEQLSGKIMSETLGHSIEKIKFKPGRIKNASSVVKETLMEILSTVGKSFSNLLPEIIGIRWESPLTMSKLSQAYDHKNLRTYLIESHLENIPKLISNYIPVCISQDHDNETYKLIPMFTIPKFSAWLFCYSSKAPFYQFGKYVIISLFEGPWRRSKRIFQYRMYMIDTTNPLKIWSLKQNDESTIGEKPTYMYPIDKNMFVITNKANRGFAIYNIQDINNEKGRNGELFPRYEDKSIKKLVIGATTKNIILREYDTSVNKLFISWLPLETIRKEVQKEKINIGSIRVSNASGIGMKGKYLIVIGVFGPIVFDGDGFSKIYERKMRTMEILDGNTLHSILKRDISNWECFQIIGSKCEDDLVIAVDEGNKYQVLVIRDSSPNINIISIGGGAISTFKEFLSFKPFYVNGSIFQTTSGLIDVSNPDRKVLNVENPISYANYDGKTITVTSRSLLSNDIRTTSIEYILQSSNESSEMHRLIPRRGMSPLITTRIGDNGDIVIVVYENKHYTVGLHSEERSIPLKSFYYSYKQNQILELPCLCGRIAENKTTRKLCVEYGYSGFPEIWI